MMDDVAANRAIENGLTSYPNVPYRVTENLDGRPPNHGGDVGLAAAAPRSLTGLAEMAKTNCPSVGDSRGHRGGALVHDASSGGCSHAGDGHDDYRDHRQ